jgi:hypothetical protein
MPLFTVSGKSSNVRVFNEWVARITAGLTVAEAAAVLLTNPRVMKNIEDMEFVTVKFNPKAIELALHNRKE